MKCKVLFVTGDEFCACAGSGRAEVSKTVVTASGERLTFWVKEQCDCVEALEAELVFLGGPAFRGGEWNHLGTVVPKKG